MHGRKVHTEEDSLSKTGLAVKIESNFKDTGVAGLLPVFFVVSFLRWQIKGFLPKVNEAAASLLPRLLQSHHSLCSCFDWLTGLSSKQWLSFEQVIFIPKRSF